MDGREALGVGLAVAGVAVAIGLVLAARELRSGLEALATGMPKLPRAKSGGGSFRGTFRPAVAGGSAAGEEPSRDAQTAASMLSKTEAGSPEHVELQAAQEILLDPSRFTPADLAWARGRIA